MGVNMPKCPDCGIPMVDRWHGRSACIAELRARLEESRSELAELRASWTHTGEARAKALADAAEVCRAIKARNGDVRVWAPDLMEECEETILALDKSEKP